jgi:hypothetical protein
VNVSPDDGGNVKVNGLAASSYPSVSNIVLYSTVILEAIPAFGYAFSGWSGDVTGTANPTFLTVNCDKTVTATFTPLISKLYFPHVASQAGNSPDLWKTEVCLINTSDQALSGTLRSYRHNGQAASSSKTITLAAHGRWSRIVGGGEFTNPAEIGYMVFESASDSVVGYTKFYIDKAYRTAIPAVREGNSSHIYIPHIASNAQWRTKVILVNTTSAPEELTITINNGQSRPITLAANEHREFDIASLFDNPPQPDIESAVIIDASGIIGLALFGSTGSEQLDGIPLNGRTASTLYYPHVADDGWWTGIVAHNTSNLACRITITPYDAQGTPFPPIPFSLAGKGKYIGTPATLGLPDQTAWFKISSLSKIGATCPLTGFELFGTVDNQRLAGFGGVRGAGAKAGIFPKIEKDGWTGIAFVNTETTAASVTLIAYRDNGTPVATQVLTVSGHAKIVNLAEDLFLQDISGATYIAYSSDRNIVGFQLNGSADEMMLDGLPALGGTN